MRIWREATERGGGAAGRRFSRIIIFVYLPLRKLFTFARPRASGPRARRAAVSRHAVPARLAVTRLYPTDDRVSRASQTTHTFRVLRPETGVSVLRRQTTSHTHDRRVRTCTQVSSPDREAPLPRFGGMWPHHPFATQRAADPTVRSSSSASMVTLQSFSKCIGFAPRRPKLHTGQNEAAERIRQ